jgi:hypothetical protein
MNAETAKAATDFHGWTRILLTPRMPPFEMKFTNFVNTRGKWFTRAGSIRGYPWKSVAAVAVSAFICGLPTVPEVPA